MTHASVTEPSVLIVEVLQCDKIVTCDVVDEPQSDEKVRCRVIDHVARQMPAHSPTRIVRVRSQLTSPDTHLECASRGGPDGSTEGVR